MSAYSEEPPLEPVQSNKEQIRNERCNRRTNIRFPAIHVKCESNVQLLDPREAKTLQSSYHQGSEMKSENPATSASKPVRVDESNKSIPAHGDGARARLVLQSLGATSGARHCLPMARTNLNQTSAPATAKAQTPQSVPTNASKRTCSRRPARIVTSCSVKPKCSRFVMGISERECYTTSVRIGTVCWSLVGKWMLEKTHT